MYTSKQNDIIASLLFGKDRRQLHKAIPSDARKNFAKLVDTLVKSYKSGKISEEVLTELIKQAASVFIESEVSNRVEKALCKKSFSSRHHGFTL